MLFFFLIGFVNIFLGLFLFICCFYWECVLFGKRYSRCKLLYMCLWIWFGVFSDIQCIWTFDVLMRNEQEKCRNLKTRKRICKTKYTYFLQKYICTHYLLWNEGIFVFTWSAQLQSKALCCRKAFHTWRDKYIQQLGVISANKHMNVCIFIDQLLDKDRCGSF